MYVCGGYINIHKSTHTQTHYHYEIKRLLSIQLVYSAKINTSEELNNFIKWCNDTIFVSCDKNENI